ncbi:MAG: 3-phosphoshikimate 1-carboxyvinyltransferase [Anaerolineales bacterium]|nr:3-phosphoshikimate 1-carboxyvinyltransferase [Anaerolineales bacterium]
MRLSIRPGNSLNGQVIVPGDKSISHRAALLGALGDGESRIEHFLNAGVTDAMLSILTQLRVPWQREGENLSISGNGWQGLHASLQALNCGNSGTTMRLLAGGLSAANIPAILDGSPGLRKRPMKRIVEPLKKMGVSIEATKGCAPIIISSTNLPLRGILHKMPVASAQVKSCLLLAALAADSPCIIVEPGPSRDHTECMLSEMGIAIEKWTETENNRVWYFTRLNPDHRQLLPPLNISIPGDFSAAAFFIVAAAIVPGSCIALQNVGLNPTRTGLLEVLIEMGGNIQITERVTPGAEPVGDVTVRHSVLKGIEISGSTVVRMIDEFPVFAVAAAYANGKTIVREAKELRFKESDRISALGGELTRLDVDFSETADGFIIQGCQVRGDAIVEAHGDHRIAMALTVAALAAEASVGVDGAEFIGESFPEFLPCLKKLGADVSIVEEGNGE